MILSHRSPPDIAFYQCKRLINGAVLVMMSILPALGAPDTEDLSSSVSISVSETSRTKETTSNSECDGKLGVHRTITVSNKNSFLVGVGTHARIGLERKELVLTFDDGPRSGITEPILEALKAECVKATFFSLGRAARENPKLLRRTADEGHTIGTHTQSHKLLTQLNSENVRAEVRRGINSVRSVLDESGHTTSNFFRYPFLGRSKRTDAIVKDFNLVAFHMNIDSWDWRKQTPDELLQLTLKRVRGEGSGVVLFHDIQKKTAIVLPRFLQALREEGYKIVHIVPGESDFDYREHLISKVVTPRPRPQQLVKQLEPSEDKPSTIGKNPQDTDRTLLASAPVTGHSIDVVSTLPGKQTGKIRRSATLKNPTKTAALHKTKIPLVNARPKRVDHAKQEHKIAKLKHPPLPLRKPPVALVDSNQPFDLRQRGFRRPEPILQVVDRSALTRTADNSFNSFETSSTQTGKQRKRKKKSFFKLRRLLTRTDDR